jgi:protocatechuate 4,5-dioxygenase alpha chain
MIIDLFIFGNGTGILTNDCCPSTPMQETRVSKTIPGTTPFDGDAAQKGYALNKMCYSFNQKDNRDAFVADPEAYMKKYGLNAQQAEAIRSRQVLALIAAGGNAYYLAKFAGIFGLDMQDIGAQQTGMSKDQFKARLVAANEQC